MALSAHQQDSYYGTTPYLAQQHIGFGQLTGTRAWGTRHSTLHGLALRYTRYDDNTPATALPHGPNHPDVGILPGAFAQHEWKPTPRHTLLAGARADWDNRHGLIPTPRLAWKWAPTPLHTLRLNAGSGFRVVNLFTEEHAALTGSRRVVLAERLRPERSWNTNLDYLAYATLGRHLFSVNLNLFANYFINKILPDYEWDPEAIRYANLAGYALYAGGAAALEWNTGAAWYARAGITLLSARTHSPGGTSVPYLTEWANGTWLAAWRARKWNLRLEYTGNLVGPMRLPTFAHDPRPNRSPWYSIQSLQLTKAFPALGLEVYGGVKNLLNFRPPANSILRAHDPFDRTTADPDTNPYGHTFDTAYVYASFQGIRGFVGARYTLGQ
jgi:outer membrane receptor for ferrienterochelin and colicins